MTAEGFYHCQVNPVSRAKGHSMVAKAAYRDGGKLAEEATGQVHDYSYRQDVAASFIIAREHAPSWAHANDVARFANEIARADGRNNARFGTETELGLPNQFTDAQRKELVSSFVRQIVEKYGVAAHVAIHIDPGNQHAHVLFSHRVLGPEGFGEIANARTVPKKVKGEIKQIGIAGVFATPEDIKAIRKEWEQFVNRAYEKAGLDIRVDHRSHKDRGIEDEPTQHMGGKACAMEARGVHSDRGNINRAIKQRNATRQAIREQRAIVAQSTAEIIDLEARRAAAGPAVIIGHHVEEMRLAVGAEGTTAVPRTAEPRENSSKRPTEENSPQPKDQAMKTPEPPESIPDNANRELLAEIAETARADRHGLNERANAADAAGDKSSAEALFEQGDIAKARQKEAEYRLLVTSPQPSKDQAMPDEQSPPANQNLQNPPPGYRVGESVPISFGGPESRAAYDPAEHLETSSSRTPPTSSPELDEQQKAEAAAKVREVWQQPAFSLDSIRADPWTAVYLPAPENASPILLNEAYNAAGRCIEATDHQGREYADAAPQGPLISQGDEAGNRAKAEARRDELQARLYPIGAPAAEQPRRERIAALEATAHDAATEITVDDFYIVGRDDIARQATPEPATPEPEPVRNDPVRSLRPSEPQPGRYDQLKVEIISEARRAPEAAQPAAKAPEIDLEALQSPDPIAAPVAQPEATSPTDGHARARVMRFEAQQAIAGQEAVAESIRDGAQETMTAAHAAVDRAERISGRVLGWIATQFENAVHYVAEFFAPEPKMTRAQVHDTLQAHVGNLDKDHAQAVDAAQREDVAAYEQQAHEAKSQVQAEDLSLAERFGRNATREVNQGREREADHGHELE